MGTKWHTATATSMPRLTESQQHRSTQPSRRLGSYCKRWRNLNDRWVALVNSLNRSIPALVWFRSCCVGEQRDREGGRERERERERESERASICTMSCTCKMPMNCYTYMYTIGAMYARLLKPAGQDPCRTLPLPANAVLPRAEWNHRGCTRHKWVTCVWTWTVWTFIRSTTFTWYETVPSDHYHFYLSSHRLDTQLPPWCLGLT